MKKGDIKKINSGDYYVINGQEIKATDKNLIFDYSTSEYVNRRDFPSSMFVEGVVQIYKNGRLKIGFFRKNVHENIVIVPHTGKALYGINYELVRNNYNYRENTADGYFYYYKNLNAKDFNSVKLITRNEKNNLPYNMSDMDIGQVQKKFDENNIEITPSDTYFGKILKKYTFGFEFETTKGFIPQRLTSPLGLIALRDGSIPGLEYVTLPLQGPKGIAALRASLKLLKERTETDRICSIHLHIGGLPRTKKAILATYLLLVLSQDNFFDAFPITKRFNWGVKNKNYTRPYCPYMYSRFDKSITNKNISENFDILMQYLAQSNELNGVPLSKVKSHPKDPSGQHKWYVQNRYHWANLIPILFTNKKTIEFRIHTPTYDENKLIMFLVTMASLLNWAETHTDEILQNHQNLHNTVTLYDQLVALGLGGNANVAGHIADYWQRRIGETNVQNRSGDVEGTEKEIHAVNILDSNTGKGRIVSDTSLTKKRESVVSVDEYGGIRPQRPIRSSLNDTIKRMEREAMKSRSASSVFSTGFSWENFDTPITVHDTAGIYVSTTATPNVKKVTRKETSDDNFKVDYPKAATDEGKKVLYFMELERPEKVRDIYKHAFTKEFGRLKHLTGVVRSSDNALDLTLRKANALNSRQKTELLNIAIREARSKYLKEK